MPLNCVFIHFTPSPGSSGRAPRGDSALCSSFIFGLVAGGRERSLLSTCHKRLILFFYCFIYPVGTLKRLLGRSLWRGASGEVKLFICIALKCRPHIRVDFCLAYIQEHIQENMNYIEIILYCFHVFQIYNSLLFVS